MVARRGVPRAPERDDIVWLDFDPQAGHEQAGRRPALVLSPKLYNQRSGLALMVPVTSRAKGYPFEVELPAGLPVKGVVLADHVKSLDWAARGVTLATRVPSALTDEVLAKLRLLL